MKQDFLRLIIQGLQRTGDSLSRGFPALSQPLATCKQMASCLLSKANHPIDGREEIPKAACMSRPEVLGAGPRLDPHKVSSVGEVGRSKAPKQQNALRSLPRGLNPPTLHSFWR